MDLIAFRLIIIILLAILIFGYTTYIKVNDQKPEFTFFTLLLILGIGFAIYIFTDDFENRFGSSWLKNLKLKGLLGR